MRLMASSCRGSSTSRISAADAAGDLPGTAERIGRRCRPSRWAGPERPRRDSRAAPRHRSLVTEQAPHQRRDQCGALGEVGDDHVLVIGVDAVSGCPEPVEGRHAEGRGEVAVRAPADGRTSDRVQAGRCGPVRARARTGRADIAVSSGGASIPPVTLTTAPSTVGATAVSGRRPAPARRASMRGHRPCTARGRAPRSRRCRRRPASGSRLCPPPRRERLVTARRWWASSMAALTPALGLQPRVRGAGPRWRSGSPPGPCARSSGPPSGAGRLQHEHARATAVPRPRSAPARSARPAPRRPVISRLTPSSQPPAARWAASAQIAIITPAFMSRQPGPRSTPSTVSAGCVRSEPTGHTVSWWPRSSTRRAPSPNRQSRCVQPSRTTCSGATPRRASPMPASSRRTLRDRAVVRATGTRSSRASRCRPPFAGRSARRARSVALVLGGAACIGSNEVLTRPRARVRPMDPKSQGQTRSARTDIGQSARL